MSLKEWEKHGWLKPHKTSTKEISNLFDIVKRDLESALTKDLTADWKFGIAYNAALKLCAILLYSEGYKPENANAHFRTIDTMPEILGPKHKKDAEYLNLCRAKRNLIEYTQVDGATEAEAKELVEFGRNLQIDVEAYLSAKHPGLRKNTAKGRK